MSTEPLPAREAMEFDVVIVGAGPAGLAAAIRLKQLSPEICVVVVEKGSEVGAHILSGAVIDPIGLDRLLPDWRNEDAPIKTKVSDDRFYWLSATPARPPAELHDAAADEQSRQLTSSRSATSAAGSRPRRKRSASKSIRAFAAAEVLFDANWCRRRRRHRRHGRRAGTAIPRTASRAAWSCAPNTLCSRKARAAASARL